ncbi:MAG: guanylate kinase [Clostridia bacterium]|nr:guanylate kinase [Clostridia bacterium]
MNNQDQKGLIVVISGPAGSGKSTVTKFIRENPDYVFSISCTTRYMRAGETDGVDYYFTSRSEFLEKLDKDAFLEHAEYCDEMYGTPEEPVNEQLKLGRNVILEIDVVGAMQVKAKRPDAVLIMLLPPSFSVQEKRLRSRGTEPEEKIRKRLEKTRREIPLASAYDYIVFNEDGKAKEAAEDIFAIVRAERFAANRIPDIESLYFEK